MAKKVTKKNQEAGNRETSSKYNNVSFRGQSFVGIVVSDKPMKSVTVEFTRRHYVPKYERYEKRLTRLHAHNPPHIDAKEGDIVRVMETRPLSKTIHHVIVEKIGEKKTYKGQKMVEEEEKAKITSRKKEEAKEEAGKKPRKQKSRAETGAGEKGREENNE
jgi:small subunit ribosomal protein S17